MKSKLRAKQQYLLNMSAIIAFATASLPLYFFSAILIFSQLTKRNKSQKILTS
jgi:hypothetical protein